MVNDVLLSVSRLGRGHFFEIGIAVKRTIKGVVSREGDEGSSSKESRIQWWEGGNKRIREEKDDPGYLVEFVV